MVQRDRPSGRQLARQVAQEQGWPEGGFNEGVKGLLSTRQTLEFQCSDPPTEQPSIRASVPTAVYRRALTCMAMRTSDRDGEQDINGIARWLKITGSTRGDGVLNRVEHFYPRSRIPPKVAWGVEEILVSVSPQKDKHDVPSPAFPSS